MLLKSVPSMIPYESQSALAVGSNRDAGTYLTKGVCGLIDLDIEMGILEETKCKS